MCSCRAGPETINSCPSLKDPYVIPFKGSYIFPFKEDSGSIGADIRQLQSGRKHRIWRYDVLLIIILVPSEEP